MMKSKGAPGNAWNGDKKPASTPEERFLDRKVRAANFALLAEKLWPRVWLPLSIAGIFVLLSAFEVWQYLPPRVHLGLLWAFIIGFFLSFIPLLSWRRPGREDAFARIEQTSAIDHRPLTAFHDTLSQENPSHETRALWEAHRVRAAEALKKLKAGAPHPRIDKYDPFALRAALILMLVAAGAWASSDLGNRVVAAFAVPEIPAGAGFRIDAWITPPAYTRKDPLVLANGAISSGKDEIAVPEGSVLTVKINGPDAASYRVKLGDGKSEEALKPTGQPADTYAEYTHKIERPGTLSIKRSFGVNKTWTLTAIPDKAPTIAFAGPVGVSPRGVILFKYKVDDDYGVTSAEARIERIVPASKNRPEGGLPLIGKPPVFPLSLPHAPVKSGEGKTYRDLTAHPWAGLPVVATLLAKDEAGNTGLSSPRGFILPERTFTKPLAKAVIGQRRELVEDPDDTARISGNLGALALSAQDDGIAAAIYLNLRSASMRLKGRPAIEKVESVVDQLWDIATRIEDGNLSSAERELRAAQDRLRDAIERGASQQEIQKAMADLRQALNRYLQALREQKSKDGSKTASSPSAKTVSPEDLQQLLDKIESLTKAGSQEAAAEMLNQLRDILESLQNQQQDSASQQENAERLKQIGQLSNLMRQQQQLLDQTFRAQQGEDGNQSQNGQQPGQQSGQGNQGQPGSQGANGGKPGGSRGASLKQRQDDIQKQLQDLLSEMGEGKGGDKVQRKLKDAEGSMGSAGEALQQNDLGDAGDQEGRALESMRQSTRELAKQMMQAAGRNGRNQANRDPLGREQNGNELDGEGPQIPTGSTLRRARAIREQLWRRLGERSRPPIELDYLERLLKPY